MRRRQHWLVCHQERVLLLDRLNELVGMLLEGLRLRSRSAGGAKALRSCPRCWRALRAHPPRGVSRPSSRGPSNARGRIGRPATCGAPPRPPPTNVWPTENQRKVPPDHVRHGPGSHRKARDRCVAREVLVALALRPGRRDGKPSRADGDGVGRERTSRSRRGMEGRCAECCGAIDSRHGTAHTQLLAPRLRRRLRAVV